MRPKELQCIITFNITTEAMAFEETAKKCGLDGRLIPVPVAITANCGLAWRENIAKRPIVENILEKYKIGYDEIYELVI